MIGCVLLDTAREQRRPRPGVRLRFAVWRHRSRLDAALADGQEPKGDPLLTLRAEQLTSAASRLALARTLRNLIDAAEEPPDAWGSTGSQPPLQREGVLAARDDLVALADRLSEPRAVRPQGAARAAALVWDSASRMYSAYPDGSVSHEARDVLEALDAMS